MQDQDPILLQRRWKELYDRDGLFVDANDALQSALLDGDAIEKIIGVLGDMRDAGELKVPMPGK